jgi:D-lactate dehydrogenase (cytochrome)
MIRITDEDGKIEYQKDAANYTGLADKVFLPESTDEISTLVKELYESNTPYTISAARTGLTGGGVPHSGVLISTERLDKIISIDIANKTALLEPGVRLQTFHDELKQHNLMYPSNPTETWSTIGGNVANNASGAKTFKYGATRNFVNYLEIVLPDGDELHLKRGECIANGNEAEVHTTSGRVIKLHIPNIRIPKTTKNAAGYYLRADMDMIDLFIGSEGTLGVVKKIGLDLLYQPDEVLSAIVFFDDYNNLLNFAEYLRNDNPRHLRPRLIEYFDHNSLKLLSEHHSDLPTDALSAVWVEFETNDIMLEHDTLALYELTIEHTDLVDMTWVAMTDKDREKITKFRHDLPLAVNELLTKYGQQKIYTDTSVPASSFRLYYNEMYSQLNTMGLDYVVFGHLGDCHLHANLFVKSEEDKVKADVFYHDMMKLAIELDGTISAEHGIGKIKRPYMKYMFTDDEIKGMQEVKKAFDPKNLMALDTLFFNG